MLLGSQYLLGGGPRGISEELYDDRLSNLLVELIHAMVSNREVEKLGSPHL